MKRLLWVFCLFGLGGVVHLAATPALPQSGVQLGAGRMRTYYVAAEEIEWDYAPLGVDMMTGQPFAGVAAAYTQPGPNHIGRVYRKAVYREYTDATFSTVKPRAGEEEYLGLLGPILRAEVGDTIRVVFRNKASRPYSMHPHGAFYEKASEASVPPGSTFTYEWEVPERAGPDSNDSSSIVRVYDSHVNEDRDVASGLIGAIVVARRGEANPDGTPKDVDREIVALFTAFNENQSWYVQENIAARISAADQRTLNTREANFSDSDGYFTFTGTGFAETNYKFSVNGYLYGNGPMMTMRQGQHVRWYMMDMGDAIAFHSPHWHGNTTLSRGARRDTIFLMAAGMETADMVPDAPGLWMFHCHVDDHMDAGMMARYEVLPEQPRR